MSDRLNVMYIDDSAQDREQFRKVLRLLDKRIHYIPVRHGQEAIDYLSDTHPAPHFIFLDLNMPGMDGLEVLQRIKQIKQATHIPVFVYASKIDSVEETARLLGAVSCIKKESDIDKAHEVVRVALLKYLEENKS